MAVSSCAGIMCGGRETKKVSTGGAGAGEYLDMHTRPCTWTYIHTIPGHVPGHIYIPYHTRPACTWPYIPGHVPGHASVCKLTETTLNLRMKDTFRYGKEEPIGPAIAT